MADGTLVATNTAQSRRKPVVSAPHREAPRFWKYLSENWLFAHYKSGFVTGLLLLDGFALLMCLLDYDAFKSVGLEPGAALRVARETIGDGAGLRAAVSVFLFLLAAPLASGLLPHFASRSNQQRGLKAAGAKGAKGRFKEAKNAAAPARQGWRRLILTGGWMIVAVHFILTFAISGFTLVAYSMQNLSSWQDQAPNYTFTSSWMWVVGGINWLYSGIFLPVILKFGARFVGREGPHFGEVLREVSTEFSAEH
jgi:hypothetical protein